MSFHHTRRQFVAGFALAGIRPAHGGAGQAPPTLISFRIGTAHWLADERFEALLEFFARHPGAVDELAFFTSETHPPLPLEEMVRRAERLSGLMRRVRERGMRAGINILSTMGHHEENLPNSLATGWQRVMDIEGRVSQGSFCPSQPELIDYARKIYKAMAKAGPDFLWVDDDVRLGGHKPINLTCFCDLCLENFSRQTGRRFTRASLAAAFETGALDERLGWRRKWLEHNRGVIDNLFRAIEESVHRVKPGLPLGFMTGDRFWEGYAFEQWAKTLAGPGKAPVMWRPGGGFYSDEKPIDLVDKANALGRQVAALPAEVVNIQSELENFPYQRLRKSEQTTVVEAAAHMAAGTMGTAFNVLTMHPDPLEEYVPLFRRIAQCRPFYQALQRELGRNRLEGLWPAWNHDFQIASNPDGKWLAGGRLPLAEPYTLGEIGIPICYDPKGRAATALARTAPLAFTKAELREIFGGGVLMDVEAWQAMERLNLAAWTGVRAVKGVDVDAIEVLAKHPLSGRHAGWSRDCRQSFWWERGYLLEPQSDRVEMLARIRDYGGRDHGPCMSAFENELGGRVVVMGYYPWSQIHSTAKTEQMKSMCEWLSRDRLPAVAESFAKVTLWTRRTSTGKRAVVVLNASLDALPGVSLRVRAAGTVFTVRGMSGPPRQIAAERAPSHPGCVRLPLTDLAPWNMYLVVEA